MAANTPNIVIILADDLGYGDITCYNPDSKIPTPNLDRLAAGGVRATDAHSPAAVCSPTRYGLLTGRYPWRGILKQGVVAPWGTSALERDRLNIRLRLRHGMFWQVAPWPHMADKGWQNAGSRWQGAE